MEDETVDSSEIDSLKSIIRNLNLEIEELKNENSLTCQKLEETNSQLDSLKEKVIDS